MEAKNVEVRLLQDSNDPFSLHNLHVMEEEMHLGLIVTIQTPIQTTRGSPVIQILLLRGLQTEHMSEWEKAYCSSAFEKEGSLTQWG